MCLNPWPLPCSPALEKVLPGAPCPANYRGAFAPQDYWAHGWTAIYDLGYLAGAYFPPSGPACVSATLTIVKNGGNVEISWTGISGGTYRVRSSTDVGIPVGSWTVESTFNGVGPHTYTTSAAVGNKFFVVTCE
jgi:hypothetical protein